MRGSQIMSAEVVKSKKVKTRKEHKCFGCNYTIPKGFDVERQVIRNGRELYTIHLCNSCQKLIEENLNPGEEYEEGYFEDFYIKQYNQKDLEMIQGSYREELK